MSAAGRRNSGGGGVSPTFTEQAEEIRRELKQRRRVFPRWVGDGKLAQADADHRIACLEATLALVEAQIVSHGGRLL